MENPMERIRYKVLTENLYSTGLAHSIPVKYKRRRWNHPHGDPLPGPSGPGGLWASRDKGQARSLAKYLWDKYEMPTRIFICLVDQVLWETSYRTKTNRLFLLDQIL